LDNKNKMTVRIPLVMQNGQPEELQSGDQLSIVSPISGLTAGRLAVSASASTLQDYSGGTFDGTTLAVPTITPTNVGTLPTQQNFLINGGFDYFQRTLPGTLTAVTNDTYGPDRWNILTETTTVQIQQVVGDVNSIFAGTLKQNQAAAQHMGLLQILEMYPSFALRGKTVIAQARIYCTSSQPIRIAILEWTGTADVPTSNVVKSATWAGPYTANNFFLTSNLTVTAVAAVTPATNTWTALTVTGTVSASCNNLIVFIWTEGTAAQNVTLGIAEAGLYTGTQVRNWEPRLPQQELALCQRYYEKSYSLGVPPGSLIVGDGVEWITAVTSGWLTVNKAQMKVVKRIAIIPRAYSYDNGTIDKASEHNTGGGFVADRAFTAAGVAQIGTFWNGTGMTIGNIILFHWTADAEL
jgi:hypothetical protein